MLELGDAELELVEVLARDEVQLVDERAHRAERLLGQPRLTSAHAGGELDEQLLEDVREPLATARDHAASSGGAGGASRAAPAPPGRTAPAGRHPRAPASARRRAPAPTP